MKFSIEYMTIDMYGFRTEAHKFSENLVKRISYWKPPWYDLMEKANEPAKKRYHQQLAKYKLSDAGKMLWHLPLINYFSLKFSWIYQVYLIVGVITSTWVDPVSWLSRKVTAREGHHPITPGGFPCGSRRRHNCPLTASCMAKHRNIHKEWWRIMKLFSENDFSFKCLFVAQLRRKG